MKEAFWGVGIILMGMLGIVITQLFQNITVRDDQIFYLTREVAEAAMFDAVDLAHYRTTGKIKIVEEKFVENFARRFAESTNINTEVRIKDIIEEPPKVTIDVGTNIFSLFGDSFFIAQSLDGIIESKQEFDYIYGDVNIDGILEQVDLDLIERFINGETTIFSEKEKEIADINLDGKVDQDDYDLIKLRVLNDYSIIFSEDGNIICDTAFDINCKPFRTCIDGDVKLVGWQKIDDLPKTTVNTNITYDRDVIYEICESNDWKTNYNSIKSITEKKGDILEHTWDLEVSTNIVKKIYTEKFQQHIITGPDTIAPVIKFFPNQNARLDIIGNVDMFSVIDTNSTGLLRIRYEWSRTNFIPFNDECNTNGLAEYTLAFNKEEVKSKALYNKPNSFGIYSLHVCTIDVAGNVRKTSRSYLYGNVSDPTLGDINPPVITFSDENKILFSTIPNNVATIRDTESGLKTVRYEWGYGDYDIEGISKIECSGGNKQSISIGTKNVVNLTASKNKPTTGESYILHICAEDTKGNINYKTKTYVYDTTPPTDLALSPTSHAWTDNNIEITPSAKDYDTGVSSFKYCKTTGTNCTPNINLQNNSKINLTEGGQWKVCITAVNGVGLESEKFCSANEAYKLQKDSTIGSITRTSISPTNNASASFRLSATFPSGSGEMRFSCNNTNWTSWENFSTTKILNITNFRTGCNTTNGTKTVYVKYRDKNLISNESDSYNAKVVYDTTVPLCGTTWSPSISPWKNSGGQTFTLSGSTDAGGSGIKISGGSCTTGVSHGNTCTVTISDNAGNTRICTSPTNRVETTKPTITFENTSSSTSYYRGIPNKPISVRDLTSGLRNIRYQWRTNTSNPFNATCTTGGTAITVTSGATTAITNATTSGKPTTSSGSHYLHVCSRDIAGNVRTSYSRYYLDVTAPTCGSWSPSISPWKSSGGQRFTLSGSTDSNSGINTSSGSCTTGGAYGSTCTVTISDNAGNTRNCTSPINRVDSIAPTIGISITKEDAGVVIYSAVISCSDEGGSGCNNQTREYSTQPTGFSCTENRKWTSFANTSVAIKLNNFVCLRQKDNAGNWGYSSVVQVK